MEEMILEAKTDEKLELFFDKDLWTEIIQKAVEKKLNKGILTQLCETQNRIAFAQLLASGQYKVAPPHIALIPKKNSTEMRKVYVNTDLDRLVLSLINEVYFKLYVAKIHRNCVSYQKGIGVSKIIKSITNKIGHYYTKDNLLGYKVDINKYFDKVNKETLFRALDELSTKSVIDKIIKEYYSEDIIIDEDGKVVEHYKSLAQGSAVSSFLANYVLRDVDEVLSNLNVLYYRYSDDILLIGKDAKKGLDILRDMLEQKGLSLNPKKVEELHKDEWFTFLGFKINGTHVTFSDDSIERFKTEIKKITKMRKGMPVGNRTVQKQAIKAINYYLYTAFLKSGLNFGWGNYFYEVVTEEKDIIMLDEFVKDHLKAMYTSKWNHTTNMHKTTNEQLKELGYVSMHHMYKLHKISHEVFNAEIRRLMA